MQVTVGPNMGPGSSCAEYGIPDVLHGQYYTQMKENHEQESNLKKIKKLSVNIKMKLYSNERKIQVETKSAINNQISWPNRPRSFRALNIKIQYYNQIKIRYYIQIK